MRISERRLRLIAHKVLKELFTKKQGLGVSSFLDQDVDPYDYSGEGGDFYEVDENDVDEDENSPE